MIANYHTHTWRCRHADGTEREYVERAIEGGLKILGFSDHSPYPFPDGYDSGMRMRLDQVEGYVDTVLALKKEYDKDIEIHLGLETEYFPRFWDQLIDFLSDYPFEYFVLGQHSLGNEIEKILYSGWPSVVSAATSAEACASEALALRASFSLARLVTVKMQMIRATSEMAAHSR